MKKLTLCMIAVLMFSGCADTQDVTDCLTKNPCGFWHGLWHGLIIPFSWIWSLFDSDTAIYAAYNNGGWYDFGFILGIGALGSSASASKN